MGDQIFNAAAAIALGLVLAGALFVPFVFLNYRRRGRLTLTRTVVWVSFLIYAVALWTYTLLPLPDPDLIRCAAPQLTPFQFLTDIRSFDTSGQDALLRNPALQQVVLNVLLFLPLGILLRWLWGRGVVLATLLGFCTSLLIEVTQLTAVWGIYPCAYRLFDVDDLIANSAGALLGGLVAWAFALVHRLAAGPPRPRPTPAMPDAHSAGASAAARSAAVSAVGAAAAGTCAAGTGAQHSGSAAGPRPVSARRRLLGGFCDLLIAGGIGFAAGVAGAAIPRLLGSETAEQAFSGLSEQLSVWLPVAVTLAYVLLTRRTPGDHTVAIRFSPDTPYPRVILRWLGGIGGYLLLTAVGGLAGFLAFALLVASPIAILATRGKQGLPGLLAGSAPVDDTPAARVQAQQWSRHAQESQTNTM